MSSFVLRDGARNGIFRPLRSLGTDSKESIPPAYVASRPVRQPYSYSVASSHTL
jgi:hypothetical protein